MINYRMLMLLSMLFITSCTDTQNPQDTSKDMSSDIAVDMVDVPKDIVHDQRKDIPTDTPIDFNRDFGRDSTPDMVDASIDMTTDETVDMINPAYRRMCISEDVQRCVVQNKTKFGDCNQVIGAVFNGHQCVEATGCKNCQGDDCPMFDSVESCASSCAQNGWCQAEKLPYFQPAQCGLSRCVQSLNVCIPADTDPTSQLETFGQSNAEPKCIKNGRGCMLAGLDCKGPNNWCCRFDLPGGALVANTSFILF